MHLLSHSNCTKHSLRHFYLSFCQSPSLCLILSLSVRDAVSLFSVFLHFISISSKMKEWTLNFVHDWIGMLSLFLSLYLSFISCVRKSIFSLARLNPSSVIAAAGWIIQHTHTRIHTQRNTHIAFCTLKVLFQPFSWEYPQRKVTELFFQQIHLLSHILFLSHYFILLFYFIYDLVILLVSFIIL